MGENTHDNFDWLPPLRKPRVVKRKPVVSNKYDLKKLYYDARRIGFEREYKKAWEAGEYFDKDFPDIATTNGTQRYIQDVLNNLGHHAERINTGGIPRKQKDGSIKWTFAGSTTGSPDVQCEINIHSQKFPVGWKIEVKKGSDTLNKAQEKYQAKMQRVGVFHTVLHVGELDMFWDEYYKIMEA